MTPLSCSQSTRELPSFPLRLRNIFAGQAEQGQFLKNCSGPGGTLPPLSHTGAVRRMRVAPWAPLTVRMPGEAEKHSQGKARGSFAPVFQHRTAVPNHRLLQHLLIPLWVCPHAHCCVRLDTTHSSTHTEGKKAIGSKRARIPHTRPRANTWIFYCRDFLQTAMSYCRGLKRLQASSFTCSIDCHLTFQEIGLFSPLSGCPAPALQPREEQSLSLSQAPQQCC